MKFGLHRTHLTKEQREIFMCMLRIHCIWDKRAKQLIQKQATKRKRDDSDCGSRDGDGHNKCARKSKRKLPTMNSASKPLPEKTPWRRQPLGVGPAGEEPDSVRKPRLPPSPPVLLQTIHANKGVSSYYSLSPPSETPPPSETI